VTGADLGPRGLNSRHGEAPASVTEAGIMAAAAELLLRWPKLLSRLRRVGLLIGTSLADALASIGVAPLCAEDDGRAHKNDVQIMPATAAVITVVASHPIHCSGPPMVFVPMMSVRLVISIIVTMTGHETMPLITALQ